MTMYTDYELRMDWELSAGEDAELLSAALSQMATTNEEDQS